MKKILIITEREWIAKILRNFFALVDRRVISIKANEKIMGIKGLQKCDTFLIPYQSKRQIAKDLKRIKKTMCGLKIVCATVDVNSGLRNYLKNEGVRDFIAIEAGHLFDQTLKSKAKQQKAGA